MLSTANRFVKTVVPAVIRPLRVLWNEMIGYLFLVFAALAGFSAYRGWRAFDGSGDAVLRVALSGFFALVMAWFGLSSFLRARKISRT
jgi:hypothetical protein